MATTQYHHTKQSLIVGSDHYQYYNINALGGAISRLPYSLKIVLENLLRHEDGVRVKKEDIDALLNWEQNQKPDHEILYSPARVLMQDFTGVPAVVDLAAMRDGMKQLGGDPSKINPLTPVDLVIDHSVQVDSSASSSAYEKNMELDYQRNGERYAFLRWGQSAFNNFRVVPPGMGICHQVNVEYLAQVVWTQGDLAYPDTLVGTDSHTTMVNGLAVLGWGVGGIEAEAVMLGQPVSMVLPEVIGVKLTGSLPEGVTATDLVLTVTEILRKKGVVNKFVEFFGDGLDHLSLADRATIANMAPEYGATCGFFPIDQETIRYLELTARDPKRIALVEMYAKAQGMWRYAGAEDPIFTDQLTIHLSDIVPSLAGPKRPQDRVSLTHVAGNFVKELPTLTKGNTSLEKRAKVAGQPYMLANGDVVIAAITSCTNTSNPNVLIAAGLLARKARQLGLERKAWVKTSLAPGSQVVSAYLEKSGLQDDLNGLGFHVVGYGCTTCIGNSGPLQKEIEESIQTNDLVAAAVLSGNRNFEGRVHPLVKANYLASPPLVVAYALAGSMNIDFANEPLGHDPQGAPVYLKDIWPTSKEIQDIIHNVLTPEMFKEKYSRIFDGDARWQAIEVKNDQNYHWNASTYINNPPYFTHLSLEPGKISDIRGATILALLGDSITTDHISPAGDIAKSGPAALYLREQGVLPIDFNSYGARRGNHEIMMRGTFANIRIKNEMVPETEGGVTTYLPSGEVMSIFDASMRYQRDHRPLVIIAGKEYGTGSSRDWAAKGTMLLGVKAVIAESFERIHRANLVGMGVVPLLFPAGVTRRTLNLTGKETISISGLSGPIVPRMTVPCVITRLDGSSETVSLIVRIDTEDEVHYVTHGGILPYVIRHLLAS
jgi:aconitate hydratase